MELDNTIKQSLQNLENAFDALDGALLKQAKGTASNDGLTDKVNVLIKDRNLLVSELDDAKTKIKTLETVNHEIESRVDAAMEQLVLLLDDGGA